jgi:hypothetical protein
LLALLLVLAPPAPLPPAPPLVVLLLVPLPLVPPLLLVVPLLDDPHCATSGSVGPVLSSPRKGMTYVAFSLASVLWGPPCSVQASRTVKPHELFQLSRVHMWLLSMTVCIESGVALNPRTLVHSLMASVWLL